MSMVGPDLAQGTGNKMKKAGFDVRPTVLLVTNASSLIYLETPTLAHHNPVVAWMRNVKPVVPDQRRLDFRKGDHTTSKPL